MSALGHTVRFIKVTLTGLNFNSKKPEAGSGWGSAWGDGTNTDQGREDKN